MSTATEARAARTCANPETVRHDIGRLEYLDPHALTIDPFNHRKKRETGDATEPDPELIASVRAKGVQVPLLVRPQPAGGALGVVWGQRRLRAALAVAAEAKRRKQPYALVPCLVREDLAGADDEALVASMLENTQRTAASRRDDVEALAQLALMELSDAQRTAHARTLGYRPAEIRAANKAATLGDESLEEAAAYDFDLIDLADYADVVDVPGALYQLSQARQADRAAGNAGRGHWAHALQRLRQERDEQAKQTSVKAELTAAHVPVIAYPFDWRGDARPLTDLRTPLGNPLTTERHAADCPGHAATLHPETYEPVFLCTAWKRHGHQLDQNAETAGNEPPADRAEQAAARKHVIAHNRAWRAAREVRHRFITELCARKTASDAAWTFLLSLITSGGDAYARYARRPRPTLVAAFLNVPEPTDTGSPFAPVIARTGRARRWRLLLAHAAAAMETEIMHDQAWRSPNDDVRGWLRFLIAEGYTPSEIERGHCPAEGGELIASESAKSD
ncbi:ParB/RepB/Spo0J family partition protein [Streptomyces johnsoniae]|uniref:ParB N-terminal domain-containing protein n=1 Tax=Streptomyces johnsoniae TaxID=3075532 RepID=A0ABU2SCY0_9ACTN|nr:ParB N-terminal domain-containing protein [Streptomyces sp. DSM 41886]MDT0446803.1 ParB N-terminal domain-containing protein [Streptomyces sp. DSM 41886]